MSKLILIFLLMLFQVACVTAQWTAEGQSIKDRKPVYEDYLDGYWWGLVSTHQLPALTDVCLDQKPIGYQKYFSVQDGIFSLLTLGIYTPTTFRVWCAD